MKKILLGLGAMTAIAAPVVVAVSCGNEESTTIVKELDGMKFTITNGKVSSISMDGTSFNSAREIGKKVMNAVNSPEGISSGIQSAMPENDVELFGLLELTGSPATHVTTKVEEFATNHDEAAWESYRDTQSTQHGGTNPGTGVKTPVHIDGNELMDVDLGDETPADLRTDFEKFRTLYNTASAKFAINLTNERAEVATMVFIMKPTTTRANSFRADTDSYPNFEVTLGSANQPWSLNYGDPQAFDFFGADFEGAWIAKINGETPNDTSDDVTQFDWSSSHP